MSQNESAENNESGLHYYEGTLLHELVSVNDVEEITSKISSLRCYIHKYDSWNKTPLERAAIYNTGDSHFEVIEILLNNGAHPDFGNSVPYRNSSPLWYLVQNGTDRILQLFLKFEADFTLSYEWGQSLLVQAIKNYDYSYSVLVFLVEDIGLDVNYRCKENGMTPLHHAARINEDDSHYEILEYLLKMDSEVNARDYNGRTPLYYVIRSGNLKIFDLFMSYEAKLGEVEDILFEFFSNNSNVEVLEKCLLLVESVDLKLDFNETDYSKLTPLHHAIKRNFSPSKYINTEVIKWLLKKGANFNACDNNGVAPLMQALPGISKLIAEDEEKGSNFANFLIEQTDFSVALKNFYGLNNDVGELIFKHLAKLKFLEIPVNPAYQWVIEENYDLFDKCVKELEVMSNTKLKNSWISYFNLLVDGRRKLKNYAGNQNLIEDYKNYDWLKKFPIYGNSLMRNFEKGIRRRELFDRSSILLSDCLPIFNPNHLIVKDILDCVLSKKYLSKFLCE